MNTIGPTTKLVPLTVQERLEQEPKYTEDKIDLLYRILVPIPI